MRSILFCLIGAFSLLGSCKKETSQLLAPGIYKGTFQRQGFTSGQLAEVTLTFNGNQWSGQSNIARYPALCNGTYNMKGSDSISFQNACVWTADFDHTLILGGNYGITANGDSIEISRNYSSTFRDVYRIKKQF